MNFSGLDVGGCSICAQRFWNIDPLKKTLLL